MREKSIASILGFTPVATGYAKILPYDSTFIVQNHSINAYLILNKINNGVVNLFFSRENSKHTCKNIDIKISNDDSIHEITSKISEQINLYLYPKYVHESNLSACEHKHQFVVNQLLENGFKESFGIIKTKNLVLRNNNILIEFSDMWNLTIHVCRELKVPDKIDLCTFKMSSENIVRRIKNHL